MIRPAGSGGMCIPVKKNTVTPVYFRLKAW